MTADTGVIERAIINVGGAAANATESRRIDVSVVTTALTSLDTSSTQQPITSESMAASQLQALSNAIHNAAVAGTLTDGELSLSITILERTVSSTHILIE